MRVTIHRRFFVGVLCLIGLLARVHAQTIDEIIVTADFRERELSELPVSASVISREMLEGLAVQHFEELINAVPNLNFSGDGHRARYLQIRGVGELEQYEGAPNPSIGFLIDDIDFSGIGTIATLFDLEQVEILRGPQGTRYGANALAGLVYMRSTMPTETWTGKAQLSMADDGLLAYGLAAGGSLDSASTLLFRASLHRHVSDGFRRNAYLSRNDTNGRDETTARLRLAWLPADDWRVDLATLFVDIDDGYDAFALDNGYTMLSDRPGRDAQESLGASLRVAWTPRDSLTLTSLTSVAESDIVFSFDADWGNAESWDPVTYDYFSFNDRSRRTLSQEFRLAGRGFLVGLYALRLEDQLLTVNQGEYYDPFYDFADSLDAALGSDYEATTVAAFAQLDHDVGAKTRLSAGLRFERRNTDYADTAGLSAGPSESMWGGEFALSRELSPALTGFASVSRGYRAGGFNLGVVPETRREFAQEQLLNIEIGLRARWLGGRLNFNTSIFHGRREDQQVRTSFQLIPGDPASFVFFTDNAARGRSRGLEADVRWQAGDRFSVYGTLGLLDATFLQFANADVNLDGREQAHAPDYTWSSGVDYRHPRGIFARIDATGRDEFYFDVSHDQRSRPYALVNVRLGYDTDAWTAQLWARNLLDKRYPVRGFYFGNEPPDFPATLYTRPGDPRQLGVTVDWRF